MVKKVVFVEPPLPPPPPVEPEDEVEDLSLTRGMVMGSIETRREMNKVLKKHSMSWQEMMQHQRSQKFIDARADVYLFLHDIGWSLTKIGRICGGRDHTTILHNLRRAIKARLTDEDAVGLAAMGGNLIQYYDWKRSQSND
jgi:type IV secretory pathway VirB10-like protein